MQAFGINVMASVIASLIWSIIILMGGLSIHRFLIPYVKSRLSDTVDISGKWNCNMTTPAGNKHDMTLDIIQRYTSLKIRIQVTKSIVSRGLVENKVYVGKGNLRDRFITLAARNEDKKSIGVVAMLLEVVGDARHMKGKGIWYSITNKAITENDLEWQRTT